MERRRLSGELQRAHGEPDRMARQGWRLAAAAGRRDRPGIKWRRAQRELANTIRARTELHRSPVAELPSPAGAFLKLILLAAALLAVAAPVFAAEKVLATRVWPAQEYTRVTLETAVPVKHQYFFVTEPHRLVLDLEGVELTDELRALPTKVGEADPYIKGLRVGVNRPNVVRVVFDLRTEVKPSVFPLAPAGEYKHRLVLDIYPAKPRDPLMALLVPKPDPIGEIAAAPLLTPPDLPVVRLEPPGEPARPAQPALAAKAAPRPVKDRLIIVAIDAGHGGEDPGARGRHGTREKDVTLAIARR